MGLALSVGAVLWFDLRLLGLTMRGDRVSDVFQQVRPWMMLGFAVMFVTGALLFSARAVAAYESTYFRLKIGLLVLGALNIVLFHTTIDRQREQWDTAGRHGARAWPAAHRWCCGSGSSPRAGSWPTTCKPVS